MVPSTNVAVRGVVPASAQPVRPTASPEVMCVHARTVARPLTAMPEYRYSKCGPRRQGESGIRLEWSPHSARLAMSLAGPTTYDVLASACLGVVAATRRHGPRHTPAAVPH